MPTAANVTEFLWGLYDEVSKERELDNIASCV